MILAAIERNYPKRLLKAGWWHMSLFQQPASDFVGDRSWGGGSVSTGKAFRGGKDLSCTEVFLARGKPPLRSPWIPQFCDPAIFRGTKERRMESNQ